MQNLADMQQKQTGTAVAAQQPKNIMALLGDEKTKKQMAALGGKVMNAERMLGLCVNAIRKTPNLAKCEPQSVLGSMLSSAGLGLEPNTPTQQAWLIPYAKRGKLPGSNEWGIVGYECQFQIGARGWLALAYRSPAIASIEAEAVHENDHFEHMQGSDAHLTFQKARKNRGDLEGAYCLVKLTTGSEVGLYMPLEEIHRIRDRSETYQALVRNLENAKSDKDKASAKKKLEETPWTRDQPEMAIKTVIKRIVKRLPISTNDPLHVAMQMDERRVDMAQMANDEVAKAVFDNGFEPPMQPAPDDDDGNIIDGEIVQTKPEPQQGGAAASTADDDGTSKTKATPAAQASSLSDVDFMFTKEALLKDIAKARNVDAIDDVAALVGQLPEEDRDEVNKAIQKKRDALGFSLE